MPYEIRWHTENRVIYQRCFGVLTLDEMRENNEITMQYINSGTPLVHNIVDMREVESFPMNLKQMGDVFKRDQETLIRLGWTVVIGLTPIMRFFATVLIQIWGARYRFVTTLEEAEDFLLDRDVTLRPHDAVTAGQESP